MKIESQQLRRLIREAIEDQVGDSLSKDIDARIASLSNEQQEMLYGIRASGDIPQFFSLLDTLTLDDDSFDSYEYFMSPAGFENSIPGMSMLKKEDVFMV